MEAFAHKSHQLIIAHLVGGAFAGHGVLVLRCFGQELHELLLRLTGARDVNLVHVHHSGGDILEIAVALRALLLVGGVLGIIAAVNEILLGDQIKATALAFLVVVLCCLVGYRSSVSGMFFIIPVLIANVVTFASMAWSGIGMSISTLPVVALGIGLGVDYAFYIVDSMKEYLEKHPEAEPLDAVLQSISSAGRGVLLTAFTLAAGVLLWSFSSLRFQAEMGLLIGLWLTVSALTSIFVLPSLALVFKPKFIFGDSLKKDAQVTEHIHQPEHIRN